MLNQCWLGHCGMRSSEIRVYIVFVSIWSGGDGHGVVLVCVHLVLEWPTMWIFCYNLFQWAAVVEHCCVLCLQCRRLMPLMTSLVKTGNPKQAKYAVRCIDAICRSKDVIFKKLFEVPVLHRFICELNTLTYSRTVKIVTVAVAFTANLWIIVFMTTRVIDIRWSVETRSIYTKDSQRCSKLFDIFKGFF